MIGELKPYPSMKDSGVEWLGDVPRHWSFVPLCSIAKVKSLVNYQDRNLLSVYLDRGVIPFSDVQEKRTNVTSEDLSKYQAVDPGDFVLNNQQAWRGSVGVSKYTGIVSPAYMVLCLNSSINPEFANLLFRERTMVAQYLVASKGVGSIQRNLYWPHLKRVSTPLPPLDEQAAIVRYLDHLDRRVRRLVRAKRKLIVLLNEQKQAIIHRAVTRGLDPDVHLKDTGIEWIGGVPKHWEVLALNRRWSVTDCKHLTVPFIEAEGSIPLASVREVQSFELSLDGAKRTSYDNYLNLIDGGRRPRIGDLIYCRNVSVGAAAIVASDEEVAMGQDVCLIRSENENQRFLNYYLRSPAMQRQLGLLLVGSTFNRINVADIKSLVIVVPPRSEQDAIASYLDTALIEQEKAASLAEKEIALITELRTRLIADVVTGKLDVRDAASALPEVDPLDTENNLEAVFDPDSEIENDDAELAEKIDE